jgi:hypothetical protein
MSPVGIKKATMAGSDLILAVKHQLFALDRHFTAEFTGILTDDAPIPLQNHQHQLFMLLITRKQQISQQQLACTSHVQRL